MRVEEIAYLIDVDIIAESIQQMIKDMKSTQHGDRTNPVYNLLKDYHIEGGVWKHTKLAIDALPEIAQGLTDALDDPQYLELYNRYKNELRAAALYHDVGKLGTQTPSQSRAGSYSFPGHSDTSIVDALFDKYDITPGALTRELVLHHHDTPAQVAALLEGDWDSDRANLLLILKGVDRLAVGPKGIDQAVAAVVEFANDMNSATPGDSE